MPRTVGLPAISLQSMIMPDRRLRSTHLWLELVRTNISGSAFVKQSCWFCEHGKQRGN